MVSKPPYGGRNLLAKSLSFHHCRSPSTGEESSIRSECSELFRLSPGFSPAETQWCRSPRLSVPSPPHLLVSPRTYLRTASGAKTATMAVVHTKV